MAKLKINVQMPMPERVQERAIRRHEVRREFAVMNAKQEAYNRARFMSVESPLSAFYAGCDPRRKVEMAEAGMVAEDQNAMSNLSPKGYQREYPAAGYYTTPYLSDVVREPNVVAEEDGSFIRGRRRG